MQKTRGPCPDGRWSPRPFGRIQLGDKINKAVLGGAVALRSEPPSRTSARRPSREGGVEALAEDAALVAWQVRRYAVRVSSSRIVLPRPSSLSCDYLHEGKTEGTKLEETGRFRVGLK